jgi:hypothetical protein
MPALWDQQEGEPDAAYAHFLIYRNLGPGRSLDAAYVTANPAARRSKTQQGRAAGNWGAESSRWHWVERADAYDVHVAILVGERAIAAQLALVDTLTPRAQQVAATCEPQTWRELLDTLDVLRDAIPEVAVATLLARPAGQQAGTSPTTD